MTEHNYNLVHKKQDRTGPFALRSVTCGNAFNDGYDIRVYDGFVELSDVHGEDDFD